MAERHGPVVIEIEGERGGADAIRPDEAAPIIDAPQGPAAMERAVQMAGRPPSRLARWFWGLLLTLLGVVLSVAAWDFVTALLVRNAILGGVVAVLIGALVVILLVLALREAAGFARLGRIDGVRNRAIDALASGDGTAAKAVTSRVLHLYAGRPEMEWAMAQFKARQSDVFDASGHLELAERVVLAPLDGAAEREIEAAARQVATVTAVVPMALADVAAALFANLRMIRRIAEIYGGRGGVLGNVRLTRTVMAHLVATGAVAIGDDLIGSVAGGGLVAKLSRRFGEGIVNGALTARVGVAAMEVCRPLPFNVLRPPAVTGLVRRALTGLFASSD